MKKYYLNIWEKADKTRIYINGHVRSKSSRIYVAEAKDGTIATGSSNIDQASKWVGGDVYGKRTKDRQATADVLATFGWNHGQKFSDLLIAVRNKELVQVIPADE